MEFSRSQEEEEEEEDVTTLDHSGVFSACLAFYLLTLLSDFYPPPINMEAAWARFKEGSNVGSFLLRCYLSCWVTVAESC